VEVGVGRDREIPQGDTSAVAAGDPGPWTGRGTEEGPKAEDIGTNGSKSKLKIARIMLMKIILGGDSRRDASEAKGKSVQRKGNWVSSLDY